MKFIFFLIVLTVSTPLMFENANGLAEFISWDFSDCTGWTQVGTGVVCDDVTNNRVEGFGADGVDRRIWYNLGQDITDNAAKDIQVDFDWEFDSDNLPAHNIFSLTGSSADPVTGSQDKLVLRYADGCVGGIGLCLESSDSGGSSQETNFIAANGIYYVTVTLNSTHAELHVYTDSARTTHQTNSPRTITLSGYTVTDLQYLHHGNTSPGSSSRTLTGFIDNETVFSGPESIFPPENLIATTVADTAIDLSWDSPSTGDAPDGYKIERESPIGGGFSVLVADTGTTDTTYSDTGLTISTQYNYRVSSHNGTETSLPSNQTSATTYGLPDAVDDLTGLSTSFSTIELQWTEPVANAPSIDGYQINYTTPEGSPDTVIINNTGTSDTNYEIFGLDDVTGYSFRVGVWNQFGFNGSGNIFNATTTSEFVIGDINIPTGDNTDVVDIAFSRSDNDTATVVTVQYPNTFNITCNVAKDFALTNTTYTNLPDSAVNSDYDSTQFVFNGTGVFGDIYRFNCYDGDGANYTGGRYVVTQSDFPILQQIENFRNGTYGTQGMIGAVDFITLAVIILSMLGFSRTNEGAGLVFNILLIGGLGYFGIIEVPTIALGGIAVVVMFAITSTRKV